MDQFWLEAAKQIPSLVVLVTLVILFLKHLKDISDNFSETLKAIGDACHMHQVEVSEEANEVIKKNTAAFDRNTEALGKTIFIIEKHNI